MSALFLALALAANAPQVPCTPQFAPLTTGSYSGSSSAPFWPKALAGTWRGEGWLGWNFDSTTLQAVRLIVRPQPKAAPGDEDEVTVESQPEVTFAVRCVPGLSAGSMQSLDVVNDSLAPDRPLTLSLGARRYGLRVQSSRPDLADARVVLTDGRRTQVLYSTEGVADEPHFDIVWAGDLDRDGQLDLVVNLSRKYSVHPYRLLLSSKAAPNQLVGEAAAFTMSD
jgi:hypothetical protein